MKCVGSLQTFVRDALARNRKAASRHRRHGAVSSSGRIGNSAEYDPVLGVCEVRIPLKPISHSGFKPITRSG
jgi:hypothetical protein